MDRRDPVYSIGQVSALLGIPAPTIRSWERRHGLRPGAHTEAGHSRYGAEDLAGLRRMRDELASGRAAAAAARIVQSLRSTTPEVLAQAVCSAAHRFDAEAIDQALDQARALHGLAAAVDLVLLPAMRELGRQWADGTCDVAREHLATTAARSWLSGAGRPAAPTDPAHGPVVLACGPDEQHTLALDALAVLLADRGVRCVHLGARVPVASLERAVRDAGARAVVISCQVTGHHRSASAALRAVGKSSADVYYAGAAFVTPRSRHGLPGLYLGESVGHAAVQLAVRDPQDPSLRSQSWC